MKTAAQNEICGCAECGEMLFKGNDLVQNPVYKCGELSYIELAHRACVPAWAENDDWTPSDSDSDDWEFDAQEADEFAAGMLDPEFVTTLADIWPA